MNCPNCNEMLVMTDRQGVEIDYCPKCRGVWLDRGELDKIIERSATYNAQPDAPIPPPPAQDHTYNQQQKPYDNRYGQNPYGKQQYPYNDPYYKHKKKKGFLDDLFDF